LKGDGEPTEIRLGLENGLAVNDNPCVTEDPIIRPLESHNERWVGAGARQHPIE
jgi:hypothetical protein